MTITEFLLARIAEDEAVAKAATPGPWEWEPPSGDSWPTADESLVTAYVPEGEKHRASVLVGWGYDAAGIEGSDEDRAHIARHNPARVLAECEAKRRIVELHYVECYDTERGDEYVCNGCVASWGDAMPDRVLCPTLRALAAIYAGHPDYDPEWSPRA